eukprot:9487759-Pyramimonas_sp.AAC.1
MTEALSQHQKDCLLRAVADRGGDISFGSMCSGTDVCAHAVEGFVAAVSQMGVLTRRGVGYGMHP